MTEPVSALRPLHPTLYQLAQDGRSLDFLFAQCPACSGLTCITLLQRHGQPAVASPQKGIS